nr:YchJ family protein [Desulfovibrio aminophilus]
MTQCPCGSGRDLEACCGPIVRGEIPAPTAEALMRSRYSAYVLNQTEHLKRSLLPEDQSKHDAEGVRQWAESATWLGLTVHSASESGDAGAVEFAAAFELNGMRQEHREEAEFERRDGIWYYSGGRVRGADPVVKGPKVGRNDPCPCGSGKKFKKCCGA